ncbi:MAG: N(4)-(beta-N-acetylglucosaminyl)-L-asparaginase [Planctomycetaceae bacterium]
MTSATLGAAAATAVGAPAMKFEGPIRSISSANGLATTKLAYQMIKDGKDTLDSVVAGVALVEADANDTSVGYGGLPNEHGVVELDAAVMHGPTHGAGAVASIQNIKHPAAVALQVLRRTDHVLIVGKGATAFAKAHGFKEENLLTERARKIWLKWKETLSDKDDWLAPKQTEKAVADFFMENSTPVAKGSNPRGTMLVAGEQRRFVRPTGTIHCSGLNAQGDISCTTTTSGLAFKIPGRVGDSPIIGAGLYCDNEVGSCGSTGRGEANLQNMCSFAAVELMRQGASPEDAGMEVLKRVAKTTPKYLQDEKGRPDFGLNFYVMAKDGRYAGVTLRGKAKFAVTDEKGTRHEPSKSLFPN